MDKGHKIVLACCATMALMLVSCASDELLGEAAGTGRAIAFEVGVAGSIDVTTTRSGADDFLPTSSLELHGGDSTFYANCDERNTIDMHYNTTSATTRGSIQTNSAFYDSFGLYGYVYDSGSSWTDNKTSLSPDGKINKIKVSKTDGKWTANAYWPGSTKKATFFAYAPYGDTNASITTTGTPSVTYTVPQTISVQQDLLIAKSDADILCDGNNNPSLNFDHALTAVKFQQGTLTEGYSIKSIEISGVYNKGKLSFDGTIWENHEIVSGTNTYSASLPDVLFLMPQTIPSGAKLKVTFTDDSKDYPFEADLSGNEWKKGYKYTYSLSVNEVNGTFIFEVTPTSPVYVGEDGENLTYTVKSYYKWDDGTTRDIQWTATFSTDDGSTWSPTAPPWLKMSSTSGNGSTTPSSYNATVSPRSIETTATSVLQNATPVSDYGLSLHSVSGAACSRTTANCYLVHAAGTYKLPLVYGNAIENGTTNSDAYKPSGTNGPYFLTPFHNHADVTIGTTIQDPLKHYSNSTNIVGPYITYQYNLWDANNTTTDNITTKTVKTIYDPCPPGFCIPTSDLWHVMTGGSSNTTGTWYDTNIGRLWESDSPHVFFPASGLRIYSGDFLNRVGSRCYYWSASPNSYETGLDLYLDSSNWKWNAMFRAYGFSVRAVLEE